MALLNKIGFGVFLCLSLFMLACSITRAAGTYYKSTLDVPWQVFFLHAEACIGILMASITVYRSVLIGTAKPSSKLRRFLDRLIQMRTSERLTEQQPRTITGRVGWFLLSKIPSATLTGLATLLGDPERGAEKTASTMQSGLGTRDMDYHEHLKKTKARETPSTPSEAALSQQRT